MKEEQSIYETCGVCECRRKNGIHLYNLFICKDCEREIVQTSPEDQQYQYFLKKLKNITQTKQYS
ncbi:sigma factor G inhibitor Gin [Pontibacillus chungwhensis]|uniref:Sigma factor G inhibitor Gin n=2 Tax=Pontibacillus TaxID=289201 RepID=A0ABY8UWY1_9BACI|nr:sigma factor G inhibitor Gin [Pontibacillus chungwhensis]MCD5326074.1 sigma factor G inhibitor Gin [Pontibacillus sp. HN14]WIF98177.1 sigma factor G inhibitor Gin [Pontibacillus chungwhensis]